MAKFRAQDAVVSVTFPEARRDDVLGFEEPLIRNHGRRVVSPGDLDVPRTLYRRQRISRLVAHIVDEQTMVRDENGPHSR